MWDKFKVKLGSGAKLYNKREVVEKEVDREPYLQFFKVQLRGVEVDKESCRSVSV